MNVCLHQSAVTFSDLWLHVRSACAGWYSSFYYLPTVSKSHENGHISHAPGLSSDFTKATKW